MSTCPATRLAWSIWVFSALFGATALVITFLGVSAGLLFLEFGAAFNAAVIAASFSTVGAMVASRRPKNPIGWIMCAGGLGVALGSLTDAYAIYVLFGSLYEPMPAIDSQVTLPKTPILSHFWSGPCTQQTSLFRVFNRLGCSRKFRSPADSSAYAAES